MKSLYTPLLIAAGFALSVLPSAAFAHSMA